jgi:hypothetical protein
MLTLTYFKHISQLLFFSAHSYRGYNYLLLWWQADYILYFYDIRILMHLWEGFLYIRLTLFLSKFFEFPRNFLAFQLPGSDLRVFKLLWELIIVLVIKTAHSTAHLWATHNWVVLIVSNWFCWSVSRGQLRGIRQILDLFFLLAFDETLTELLHLITDNFCYTFLTVFCFETITRCLLGDLL